SDAEAFEEKPVALFIVPPRAQASRRCETQATLKAASRQALLPFRSLDPFRALREPDRRRPDEERLSRSEQRTGAKRKRHLTGKAPYRFESCSLRRPVCLTGAFHACRRKDPASAGSVDHVPGRG